MAYKTGIWALSGTGPTLDAQIGLNPGIVGVVLTDDWSNIESADGVYDGWAFIESFIADALSKGFTADRINIGLTDSTNDTPQFLLDELTNRPTITNLGSPGSTSYSYRIVGRAGSTQKGSGNIGTTATGNATLDSTNKNHLVWVRQTGATVYDIYRTSNGANPSNIGKIGTVSDPTVTFDDTGIAGNGVTAPIQDGTIPIRDPGSNHPTYCTEQDTPIYWNPRWHAKRQAFITAAGAHLASIGFVPNGFHCSFMNHNSLDWNIQDSFGTLDDCHHTPCSLLGLPDHCSIDIDQPRQWIEVGFTRDRMLQVGKDIITTTANAFPSPVNLRLPIGGLDDTHLVDGVTLAGTGSVDPRDLLPGHYSTLAYEILTWVQTKSFKTRFYPQRNTVDADWATTPPATEPGFGAENWIKWKIGQSAPRSGLQDVAQATGQSPEYRQNGGSACPDMTEIECELDTITRSMEKGPGFGVTFFEIWVQDARNPLFQDAIIEKTLEMGGDLRFGGGGPELPATVGSLC